MRLGALFNSPIYLDEDNWAFVEKVAEGRHTDVSTVVNDLIRLQAGKSAGQES